MIANLMNIGTAGVLGLVMAAGTAAATDYEMLDVSVDEAEILGQTIETDFHGSLTQVWKRVGDGEGSKGILKFKLNERANHWFTDAERIGRYAWNILTYGARTEAPFPCGYALNGEITTDSGHSPYDGTIVRYSLSGTGDGGGDTCIGTGGPGWWSYSVKTTYNPASRTGRIVYTVMSE